MFSVLLTGKAGANPHLRQELKMEFFNSNKRYSEYKDKYGNVKRVFHVAGGEGEERAEELKKLAENPDVKNMVQTAIDDAVKGLKATNESLKSEKTELGTKFKGLSEMLEKMGGEEGLLKLQEMQERLSKDELGKLLAEGKTDEWFEKKTSAMKNDFESRLGSLSEELEAHKAGRTQAERALQTVKLENEIRNAAGAAGVIPTAVPDIVARASTVFTNDPEKGLVLKEGETIVYGKDGKTPKQVGEWLEEQKTEARHWWPASQGGGGEGSDGGAGDNGNLSQEKMAGMTFTEYKEARKKAGIGQKRNTYY